MVQYLMQYLYYNQFYNVYMENPYSFEHYHLYFLEYSFSIFISVPCNTVSNFVSFLIQVFVFLTAEYKNSINSLNQVCYHSCLTMLHASLLSKTWSESKWRLNVKSTSCHFS
jgi:hypothetical protein